MNKKNSDKVLSVESQNKNLESVLKDCKVNLDIWQVDHFSIEENSRGYAFKIHLKARPVNIKDSNTRIQIEKYSSNITLSTPKYKFKENGLLLEFAPFDLHWGKFAWSEETGQGYDLKEASKALNKAIDFTLNTASKFNISRIVFPFGNDFFQVDNEQNTTTAGTKQDVDSRFKNILTEGRRLVINIIEKLKQVAPVDILIIPGNHGGISEFMLGDLLDVKYEKDQYVIVNNSPTSRKYYSYGNTLIGYTHGDQEKITDLVGIMATEQPLKWADAKHRFWHLGHMHMMQSREFQGVKIEWLPSLSASDAWHSKRGYVNNTRGVISSIYDKNMGLINRIYFNL
jgi:hypothetical protein